MLAFEQTTRIQRLALSGASDALEARLRLESLFAGLELRPRGLPPAAVFIVRSLRSSTLAFSRREISGLVALERQLQQQLERLLRRAARPLQQAVPAEAEAVLFGDTAELLTCLARDAASARLSHHWWWRSLLANAHSSAALLLQTWMSEVRAVPAALSLLAAGRDLPSVIAAFDEAGAHTLLRAMAEQYALVTLVAGLRAGFPRFSSSATSLPSASAPPWRLYGLELRDLTPSIRALFGVGLTLSRERSKAAQPEFQSAVLDWLRAARAVVPSGAAPGSDAGPQRPEPGADDTRGPPQISARPVAATPLASHAQALPAAPVAPPASMPQTPKPTEPLALGDSGGAQDAKPEGCEFGIPARAPSDRDERTVTASVTAAALGCPQATTEEPPPTPEPAADPSPPRPLATADVEAPETSAGIPAGGLQIDTALGGIFFLVGVGIHLGLYGDFSTPREPGIALPLWDWLTLGARHLLQNQADDSDAMWSLLAALAGRALGQPAGAGFEPPREWQLPPTWRERDLPIQCDSAPDTNLDDWFDWLMPRVHARLARVLAVPSSNVAELLLSRRARVEVSAIRVDISMSLVDHPIEIRRAGLDRDVAWVPAAGKSFAFHFD